MGDHIEGITRASLKDDIMALATESYDRGVADERKRCFDLTIERMELFIKAMQNWSGYPGYSYQLMEAMILSQRIDDAAFMKRWKDDTKEPMKTKWFVSGGVYEDTTFNKLQGMAEEYGPFDTYEAARDVWKDKMFLNVDNALHRLTVTERLANG
jgi:hypothetical protein